LPISLSDSRNGTDIEYLSNIKLNAMKRNVKNKTIQFTHFVQSKNKKLKSGFDGALLKLGINNKWAVK